MIFCTKCQSLHHPIPIRTLHTMWLHPLWWLWWRRYRRALCNEGNLCKQCNLEQTIKAIHAVPQVKVKVDYPLIRLIGISSVFVVYSKAHSLITEGREILEQHASPVTLRFLLPSVDIPDVAQSGENNKKRPRSPVAKKSSTKRPKVETTLSEKHKSGDEDTAVTWSNSSGQAQKRKRSPAADGSSTSSTKKTHVRLS